MPKKKYSEELVETDFSESDEHDAEISSDDNDDSLPNLFGEISIDNREEREEVSTHMNRTQFNSALRDEMASSQAINCPNNCGKQFSKRGMKNHLNNCK